MGDLTSAGQRGITTQTRVIARDAARVRPSADRCKRYKLLVEGFSLRWEWDFALAWTVPLEDHFSTDRESRAMELRRFSSILPLFVGSSPRGNTLTRLALTGCRNALSCHSNTTRTPLR